MVRGCMIVDRAVRSGLIAPSGGGQTARPLLVVGAGIAGVAAALRATKYYQIPTTLLEEKPFAFSTQSSASSRHLCPTQYDFPLAQWSGESYPPWTPPNAILPWRAGQANDVAASWSRQFSAALGDPRIRRFLRFHPNSSGFIYRKAPGPGDFLAASWKLNGAQRPLSRFGMIIEARGFGIEDVAWPSFRVVPPTVKRPDRFLSTPFWARDWLEADTMPDHARTLRQKIDFLVSGGGDGALQDVLRIAFRKPAKQILIGLFAGTGGAIEFIQNRLQAIEDQATRIMVVSDHRDEQEAVWKRLHEEHCTVIEKVVAAFAPDIAARITALASNPPPQHLRFMHRGQYFTQCYGLNRFLVLLLCKYPPDWFEHCPDHAVVDVCGGGGHTCADNARSCLAEWHEVSYETGNHKRGTHRAQVVVLRHGQLKPVGDRRQLPFMDLVPYHMPV